MLVPVDQIEKSALRYYGWKDKLHEAESRPMLRKATIETMPNVAEQVTKNNIVSADENRAKRKQMLRDEGKEPLNFAYERAIGENDSVYSNFVELIISAKRKVGRIVVKEGNRNIGYATGFMVSERLMLTNWHVFEDEQSVAESEVEFFYELDVFGRPGAPTVFKLNSQEFFYSFKDLDYCFIAVNPVDVTGTVHLSSVGYIFLDPSLGKLGDEGKESLNIIHHPDGDYKQLSIRENLFTKILPTSLWYESDTAPGSSGSPVFNDQWQVVALHHMGVPAKSEDGKFYLDKAGHKIEPVGGKVDASKINWIANEGIRVSVILKDVLSKHSDSALINGLTISAPNSSLNIHDDNDLKPLDDNTGNKKDNIVSSKNADDISISFPASLMVAIGNITINISNGSTTRFPANNVNTFITSANGVELSEEKKIEREDTMDFSDCKGYEPNFLGINIPLPIAKKPIQKFVAKLKGTNKTIVNYYHYSVLFHAVRKMPIVSAINVDENPALRKDTAKRDDDWLRDNRLDYDIQLTDKFYALSGFDKGHMSRREDADWGPTPALTKLYADITCMYTNACPQVGKLNRVSRGGLWGKLEELVLEHGAAQQKGTAAKISVFNGPVFKESDPVYKSVQVPMDFYKIILWLTDAKQLKATAFRLSQTDLVDDIDFEAINVDASIEFKPYQCSIKSLEEATQLDFSAIRKFDTYSKTRKQESVIVASEDEVKQLILKQRRAR